MTAKNKRRKLPEEDLAAAVADMIASPITKANLAFLRADRVSEIPMGVEQQPAGNASTPVGDMSEPLVVGMDAVPCPPRLLWQAEQLGTLFEPSRVRRIERAQDALSLVEEKVYDLLWGPRNLRRDDFRLVHCSLQRIANEARINIKTVRELVPRLIDKGFIAIENEADPRRNIPTLYRVYSYASVLARQRERGRNFVVKTGKGVFYVHAVSAALGTPIPMGDRTTPGGLTSMGFTSSPPGYSSAPTGVIPPPPVGGSSAIPMGLGDPVSKDTFTDNLRQTSPSAYAAIVTTIRSAFGVDPDSRLIDGMLEECHQRAIATTGEPAADDELLYFTESKARALATSPNIRNHMAVLRRALPECFAGQAFRVFRAATLSRRERANPLPVQGEAAADTGELDPSLELWTAISERHRSERGYDLQGIADDPELDQRGRLIARHRIERQGRYAQTGL